MSVIVVGGAVAGAGIAAAAGVTATTALVGAGVAGAAVGGIMSSQSGKAPPSQAGSTTYNADSLYDKLLAQSDPQLASQLYAREANDQYGRPAYARLEQQLMEDAIVGTQSVVDDEGYITTTSIGAVPEGGVGINSEVDMYEYYVDSNPDLLREYQRVGGDKAQFGLRHYQNNGQREGRNLVPVGSVVDASGNVSQGEQVREYVGIENAGQTVNTGGVASITAGNQQRDFYDADGNKITKRAGFDQDGVFEGTAQLATDVAFDTQQQNVQQELGLVEEYGQRATDAYRSQGDIKESLGAVKALSGVSAMDGVSRSALDEGTGALRQEMLTQAITGLQAGGDLTDRERRAATQTARAAMQARGRVGDFSGIMAELELNEDYRRKRRAENRQFAVTAYNAEQALMDRQTARDSLYQSGLNMDRQFAAQRVGLEQATAADPFKSLLNKDSGAGLAAGGQIYGSAASAKTAQPSLYNPHVGMEFDQAAAANQDSYNAAIYVADQAMS